MADDLVGEAKRLSEAATPGPWLTPEETGDPYKVEVIDHEGCQVWPWRREEDMVFAYRARTLLPELAQQLEQAEQREKLFAAAITNIQQAPIYETRGEPASGISLTMIRAIREAGEVAEGQRDELTPLDACHHDFGMLGLCVLCGADRAALTPDEGADPGGR